MKISSVLFLVILLLPSFFCVAQQKKNEYPSKEEDEYLNSLVFKDFAPTPITKIRSISYDHIKVRHEDTHNKYVSNREYSKYYKYYDSLSNVCGNKLRASVPRPDTSRNHSGLEPSMQYVDSIEEFNLSKREELEKEKMAVNSFQECVDAVDKLERKNLVAGLTAYRILRMDSLAGMRVILYKQYSSDLWIAISHDGGKMWKKYPTGLAQDEYYHVKSQNKIDFVKNDSTIQVEVAMIRQIEQEITMLKSAKYELIEDDLILEINLRKAVMDSDKDGLTDLMERMFFTDPFSKDSDRDGIRDDVDSNPRFKSVKNEFSNLYLFLVERPATRKTQFVPFRKSKNEWRRKNVRPDTIFIVTDDVNLMGLGKSSRRVIVLRGYELTKYEEINPGDLDRSRLWVSPLFRVDEKPNEWIISVSGSFWRDTYVVNRGKKGWTVKCIRSYIS